MSDEEAQGSSDSERIGRLAEESKAPVWLCRVLALIAAEATEIPPIEEVRVPLPALIYRH